MKPLYDQKYFGVHGLKVSFHNGTAVVNGYIVRQSGTNTFMCTDGTLNPDNSLKLSKVKLAPTTTLASTLTAGYCTMSINSTEHVKRIWSERVVTTEGNRYKWSLTTSVNGSMPIAKYS